MSWLGETAVALRGRPVREVLPVLERLAAETISPDEPHQYVAFSIHAGLDDPGQLEVTVAREVWKDGVDLVETGLIARVGPRPAPDEDVKLRAWVPGLARPEDAGEEEDVLELPALVAEARKLLDSHRLGDAPIRDANAVDDAA